jgi:hypothetical protein
MLKYIQNHGMKCKKVDKTKIDGYVLMIWVYRFFQNVANYGR